MKVLEYSLLLVTGTAMLTLAALSFALYPRPLAFSNPTLFMEAIGVAGLAFLALSARGLYRVHCALFTNRLSAPLD